jgi:flavin reductase (DIM6/NTAB) family NADH-FMN oxidoreductase RutF
MDIRPHTLPWQDAYKLLVGSIVPRPIAFVSTVDGNGVSNLAPFSFFTAICADPLLVCFSPMRKGSTGEKKDTLVNIETTKEFVINIVGNHVANEMNETAPDFERNVDEFEIAGLTKEQSQTVKPYRVKECLVHLECVLHEVLHFGEQPGSGSLVIGRVQHVHVADELYYEGKIDTKKLDPIGRLAGNMYTRAMTETFEIVRKR